MKISMDTDTNIFVFTFVFNSVQNSVFLLSPVRIHKHMLILYVRVHVICMNVAGMVASGKSNKSCGRNCNSKKQKYYRSIDSKHKCSNRVLCGIEMDAMGMLSTDSTYNMEFRLRNYSHTSRIKRGDTLQYLIVIPD